MASWNFGQNQVACHLGVGVEERCPEKYQDKNPSIQIKGIFDNHSTFASHKELSPQCEMHPLPPSPRFAYFLYTLILTAGYF